MFGCQNTPQKATLYLDNVEIANENVFISHDYYVRSCDSSFNAELPLTVVLKSFGAEIEWVDDYTANILYKDKKLVLDLAKVSIKEDGSAKNLLALSGGGRSPYRVLDKELLLVYDVLVHFMREIGEDIRIVFDPKNATINIITDVDVTNS